MSLNCLAIDLGAESGRAIVGFLADGKLTLTETHRFVNQPISKPSGLHWDVPNLWNQIKHGIAASADKFQLESLALDTWGVDFALLDNPSHYRDAHTDGMLEEAFRRIPREQIFARPASSSCRSTRSTNCFPCWENDRRHCIRAWSSVSLLMTVII
jgi:rhamnulokinase